MIRIFGIFAGLFFSLSVLWAFINGAVAVAPVLGEYGQFTEPMADKVFHEHPPALHLQSDGPLGTWDVAQLQRGFQVYKEVCAACHSLKFVAFRDLEALGYDKGQIKTIAAGFQVPGVDPNTGEATTRPGTATDYFPSPYPNDVAAKAANNNAIPPDLSLMAKARHGGPSYIHAILTGYGPEPEALKKQFPDFKVPPTGHYNKYFASLAIAMPPPLVSEGQVSYAEGQPKPTVDQMATDVAAFLEWTAEPKKVKRTQTGWPVLGFLLFATILAYLAKKQVWAALKPKKKHAA